MGILKNMWRSVTGGSRHHESFVNLMNFVGRARERQIDFSDEHPDTCVLSVPDGPDMYYLCVSVEGMQVAFSMRSKVNPAEFPSELLSGFTDHNRTLGPFAWYVHPDRFVLCASVPMHQLQSTFDLVAAMEAEVLRFDRVCRNHGYL